MPMSPRLRKLDSWVAGGLYKIAHVEIRPLPNSNPASGG